MFRIKELIYGDEFSNLADAYAKQHHTAKWEQLNEERAKRAERNDRAEKRLLIITMMMTIMAAALTTAEMMITALGLFI
jgi:hypothetical protein